MKNLSDLTPGTKTFELLSPKSGKEPLGILVTMISRDDPRMKSIQRAMQDQILQQQKRGKTPTAVQLENNEINYIAAAVTGWDWKNSTVEWNGTKSPEFSQDTVKAFLREFAWAKTQFDDELKDDEGFFTN